MSVDVFIALVIFAFVSSVTPGPNNMMLLASGLNYGVKRTLPHMLGVGLGFMLMVFLVGLGLGQFFTAYPLAYETLKYVGLAYILWLAWKIAQTAPPGQGGTPGRPITFLQAAGFQWVNPKAWVMAVGAVTNYAIAGRPVLSAALVAGVFGVVNLPSVATWVLFGSTMRRFLDDPWWLRAFNWTMAALLVLSIIPVMWSSFPH